MKDQQRSGRASSRSEPWQPRPRLRRGSACGSLGCWALAAVLGCSREPELGEYDVQVQFESDPGRPLAGAELLSAGQVAGASDLDGVVELRAAGREGQRVEYAVRCPPEHRSQEQPLVVTLTTLSGDAPPPEYRVRCVPEFRSVVVAVRAANGNDLPVSYLGREVAHTDASGAAHVQLQLAGTEAIELTLNTSARPDLRPQNPSKRIDAPDRDSVLLYEQDFVVELPPPAPRRPPPLRF